MPTQLHRLLQHEAATAALRTFDSVLVGGSATPERLQGLARGAGVSIVTTYGMSETCGGCVYDGLPLDGVRVELEETGRVVLGGAVVGRGYRNRPGHPAFAPLQAPPAATARSDSFRTDDLGEWCDGRLRILGRIDDVIVTGGLKITPTPMEAVIAGLPAVAEAVVVGIPDPEWGQRVAAVVVAVDPGNPPRLDDLQRACGAAGIGDAFLPRSLTLVDGLPSRGPGKPDRRAATELAAAELARAAPSPR